MGPRSRMGGIHSQCSAIPQFHRRETEIPRGPFHTPTAISLRRSVRYPRHWPGRLGDQCHGSRRKVSHRCSRSESLSCEGTNCLGESTKRKDELRMSRSKLLTKRGINVHHPTTFRGACDSGWNVLAQCILHSARYRDCREDSEECIQALSGIE
jgi:hypothetical protein